ncbi:MAG: N-acetyltransferase [Nitrospinae bacterium]|jgi:amino-acid N-acetyltransferase|nr:N-acetyltransferase [Nitrospinota bacterium]
MIRKALIRDAKEILGIINFFANRGEMLHRSTNEIYENIRDFIVYETDEEVVGVSSLHIDWEDLAEIRSLAVKEKSSNRGIGSAMVRECIREAKELGIKKVFTLTYVPPFFEKLGFKMVDKSQFPHKIWSDCVKCPKFPGCDETALIYEIET